MHLQSSGHPTHLSLFVGLSGSAAVFEFVQKETRLYRVLRLGPPQVLARSTSLPKKPTRVHVASKVKVY